MKKTMRVFDYEKKISGLQDNLRLEMFNSKLARLLPEELKEVKGKILDVGCGAGSYTGILKLYRPQLKVYGVDISRAAIKKAKKDFPNINFVIASTDRLPFPDGFFDAVVMKCVLEHLKDPDKALVEVRRVLKPGGLFYSVTPLEGDKLVLSSCQKFSWKYQGHFQRFSRTSLVSLLEKNGFVVKRYYFWGFLLCQTISFVYYHLLNIFNLPFHFSVIAYFSEGKPALRKRLLVYLRNAVTFLLNTESLVVPQSFPGLFMHIVTVNGKI